MQIPQLDSQFMSLTAFGTYTQGRLLAAKYDAWAAEVGSTNQDVIRLGRAVEDARLAVTLRRGYRDAADATLDDHAEKGRLVLASAGKNAMKEEPYTRLSGPGGSV